MTGFDLPSECPECGHGCGWYVPGDYSLFVDSDGSVRVGRGNKTRWGQKIKAKCNNPDCDAVVNLYIEAETVNNGTVESTGALELLEGLKENDLLPKQVERTCSKCGQEFITGVDARLAGDGGIDLTANKQCPEHLYSGFVIETFEHIEPEELEEKAELLPQKPENAATTVCR